MKNIIGIGIGLVLLIPIAVSGRHGATEPRNEETGEQVVNTIGAQSQPSDALYHESLRPQFHFTAEKNWLNDPNGLVYYQGEYHLFFQHNPTGLEWGNMTWGHAVSRDLIHWRQIADALLPDERGTIFSGSAVVDRDNTAGLASGPEKTLAALFTAAGDTSPQSKGQPFTQCLAYSNDRGRTWKKYEHNPVLPHVIGGNRDPKVVWYAPTREWIMTLFLDGSDYALFASGDLKSWRQLQTLPVPGCGECPDFFEMPVAGRAGERRWVWTAADGRYLVGSFDGKRFTPEGDLQRVEWGANCYAVQTYSDLPASDGRRIQIGWMNGGRYPGMPFNQQMSFPCELTLHSFPEGLRLCKQPIREIARLHEKGSRLRNVALHPGDNPLRGVSGELFDIRAEIEPDGATEFGLRVQGQTVRYQVAEQSLSALGRSASLAPIHGRVALQILVDRTSIEVYGNGGRVTLTSCYLPADASRGLEVYALGGAAKIVSLEVYPLRSIWPKTAARSEP